MIEVELQDVQSLDAQQAQELLNRLLHVEAKSKGVPLANIQGTHPTRIGVKDQGIDAQARWSEWDGGVDRTDYIPYRKSIFQVKATAMSAVACKDEVLEKTKEGKIQVKPRIRSLIEDGGAYVVFCNKTAAEGGYVDDRIEAIIEAFTEQGEQAPNLEQIWFYDGAKITDWVNKYPSVACWVLAIVRRLPREMQFYAWSEWAGFSDVREPEQFVADDTLSERISKLRQELLQGKKVVRLRGLSGLGKSRLVFEALRPGDDEDHEQIALSNDVLYVRAGGAPAAVQNFASSLMQVGHGCILVVDDCDERLHNDLVRLSTHTSSQFQLLTITNEIAAEFQRDESYRIDQVSPDIIKGIVRQAYPDIQDSELERIVEFAHGFPQMATLLARQRLSQDEYSGILTENILMEKLLWGHRENEDDTAKRVITVCSLFTHLGVKAGVENQLSYAAELAGVTEEVFWEKLRPFIDRRIVQEHGRYIQVQPKPLALRLAMDWWRSRQQERIREIFEGVGPHDLLTAMCDQFRYMDMLQEARAAVADLCGHNGPFGKAEVLNTELGSRCFRSFVEVNPAATLEALDRILSPLSIEDLRKISPGRRNIVWALEKLVFRKDCFLSAARLLRVLAEAENETWANNATGQFLQLFQMMLAGTEAGPELRFQIIDEAFALGRDTATELGFEALDRSLETSHFTRSGGAERQGASESFIDWRPSTYKEQQDYWREGLRRLIAISQTHPDDIDRVRRIFARHIRGLITHGLLDDIVQGLHDLQPREGAIWTNAIEGVCQVLAYDKERVPPEIIGRVETLFNEMLPTSLEGKLQLYVSQLPFTLGYGWGDDVESSQEKTEAYSRELADQCVIENERFLNFLPNLLNGEQQTALFSFAVYFGERDKHPRETIDACFRYLTVADDPNPTFLGAYLSGLSKSDSSLVDQTIKQLRDHNLLSKFLMDVTWRAGLTPWRVVFMQEAFDAGVFEVREFRRFGFGQPLQDLPHELVRQLIVHIASSGLEGKWIALDIAVMYAHGHPERVEMLGDVFETIVLDPDILAAKKEVRRQLDLHHFETALKWLIGRSEDPENIANKIGALLRVHLEHQRDYDLQRSFRIIVTELLKKAPQEAWHVIGQLIVEGDGGHQYELGNILGFGSSGIGLKEVPLGVVDPEILFSWCEEYQEIGPEFLAEHLPFLSKDDEGKNVLDDRTRELLDRFGSSKGVLNALSVNLGSFSITGSVAVYYQNFIPILESLAKHNNADVSRWACSELASLNKIIEGERMRDAEYEAGIH